MIPRSDFAVERCAFGACLAGRLHAALEQVKERLRGTYIDTGGAAHPAKAKRCPTKLFAHIAPLGCQHISFNGDCVRTAQTGVSGKIPEKDRITCYASRSISIG
jgi:hypothetical protein